MILRNKYPLIYKIDTENGTEFVLKNSPHKMKLIKKSKAVQLLLSGKYHFYNSFTHIIYDKEKSKEFANII